MGNQSSDVRVFGDGSVYLGAVGETFPTTAASSINPLDFANLGYLTNQAVQFSFGRDTTDIEVWQSFDPVRTVVTKIPKTIKFEITQMNHITFLAAMGGGSITEVSSDQFKYEPPATSEIDERSMIVQLLDGDYTYRFCYRKVTLNSAVEFSAAKDAAMVFPTEWKVLAGDNGAKPFFILTDDPSFDTASLES